MGPSTIPFDSTVPTAHLRQVISLSVGLAGPTVFSSIVNKLIVLPIPLGILPRLRVCNPYT